MSKSFQKCLHLELICYTHNPLKTSVVPILLRRLTTWNETTFDSVFYQKLYAFARTKKTVLVFISLCKLFRRPIVEKTAPKIVFDISPVHIFPLENPSHNRLYVMYKFSTKNLNFNRSVSVFF